VQFGCSAAGDKNRALGGATDRARQRLWIERLTVDRGIRVQFFRRRYTAYVAGLAAEGSERAGPGSEGAHAVVNFGGGAAPVDFAVFFFEQRRLGGVLVALRTWRKGSGVDAA